MKIREIPLDDLVLDPDLNLRDRLDDFTVERYADSWERLPPITVYKVDDRLLVADGFHRHAAAVMLGKRSIRAEIIEGSFTDALDFVASVNLFHGLPLTRAERRRAVEIKLKLHHDWSDRRMAEELAVSRELVAKIRRQLIESRQIPNLPGRVGADGKLYTSAGVPREKETPPRINRRTRMRRPSAGVVAWARRRSLGQRPRIEVPVGKSTHAGRGPVVVRLRGRPMPGRSRHFRTTSARRRSTRCSTSWPNKSCKSSRGPRSKASWMPTRTPRPMPAACSRQPPSSCPLARINCGAALISAPTWRSRSIVLAPDATWRSRAPRSRSVQVRGRDARSHSEQLAKDSVRNEQALPAEPDPSSVILEASLLLESFDDRAGKGIELEAGSSVELVALDADLDSSQHQDRGLASLAPPDVTLPGDLSQIRPTRSGADRQECRAC